METAAVVEVTMAPVFCTFKRRTAHSSLSAWYSASRAACAQTMGLDLTCSTRVTLGSKSRFVSEGGVMSGTSVRLPRAGATGFTSSISAVFVRDSFFSANASCASYMPDESEKKNALSNREWYLKLEL
eukprot:m.313972 g.313972  ORF g.313972 m.313972 type:complete len:128 (-) comp55416_c0_seq5:1497-1880(-)